MKEPRILVVEDDAMIAFQMELNLKMAGCEVCGRAAEGEEAVELARTEKPDVILMDILLLGGIDGIEAARQIAAFAPVPIIFITGYSLPTMKERAMALKPAAYLIKPVDIGQVVAVVNKVCGLQP